MKWLAVPPGFIRQYASSRNEVPEKVHGLGEGLDICLKMIKGDCCNKK
jgi:hypothetical protein